MNAIHAVLLTGLAAATYAFAPIGGEEPLDPMTTGSVAPAGPDGTYVMEAAGAAGSCDVTLGVKRAQSGNTLGLSEGCRSLMPHGPMPTSWRKDADGAVALLDASGRAVVEFGFSDGAAYESFSPATPILTLRAREHDI